MSDENRPTLVLYSSPISDASARIRIALGLKKIPYQTISISLSKRETEIEDFGAINPAQAVPALVVQDRRTQQDSGSTLPALTQSNAILEYLEEAFPEANALLPPADQAVARARVRSLVGIIATDIHPLTTSRVGREIPRLFSEATEAKKKREWSVYWITRGLSIYEAMASETAGRYSFGDNITLADVYLMPQLWTAIRFGVKLDERFPVISKLHSNLMEVEAVKKEEHKPHLEGL